MNHTVVESQTFWDCVASLRRDDQYKGHLVDSLAELREQPFRNPRLQTHEVGVARNGKKIYSSDVGGRSSDRRLVWQLFNNTIVVLLYGTHAVQDRARRMEIRFDPDERVVTVVESSTDTGEDRPYHVERQRVGKLFMAWSDAELIRYGFPEPTVAVLRSLNTDEEFLALEGDMVGQHFEMGFNLVAFGHPDGEGAARRDSAAASAPADDLPAATEDDLELERQLTDPVAGAWFTRTEPEFLQGIIEKPIEDWMVFLHPDQRSLVGRNFEGPAQIRGAAGTGKTVVGLHRAASLATRRREQGLESEPLLFTTYIRSLPPVFEALYLRLPGALAGEVEFVHVDRLASQICIDAGDRQQTIPKLIDRSFEVAFRRVVTRGTPLGDAGFTEQYVRDEIAAIIKGRGIKDLNEYLEIRRSGRRMPMGRQHRQQAWDLMLEWDAEMAKQGTVDFVDVVKRASDYARATSQPRYSGIIVDEAQDLTLIGLQLLRALVNAPGDEDRANGLMLLGDGAQKIYTGGFSLRQAGVEVRGRSSILRTNYRNTGQILSAAMSVAGDAEVDDLGQNFTRGQAPVETLREGAKPLLVEAGSLQDQFSHLAQSVAELVDDTTFSTGDIAVLVSTNRMVKQAINELENLRLPAQDLAKYDGRATEKVKVGTYHRAKGLEFKAVFMPGLSKGSFPRVADPDRSDEEAAEAEELEMAQLFVAMTRARDVLVLLFDREVSPALRGCLASFDQRDA